MAACRSIATVLAVLLALSGAAHARKLLEDGGPDGCWQASYGRGAGVPLDSCPSGTEQNGALCYPLCNDGYEGDGPVCWQTCPAGYSVRTRPASR